MFRSRAFRVSAVLAVVAVVAVVGVTVARTSSTDPRTTFSVAAEKLCAARLDQISALDAVSTGDGAALNAYSEALIASERQLAEDIGALDAPGRAAELSDTLVNEATARADGLSEIDFESSAPESQERLDQLTAAGELTAKSYGRVAAAVGPWGADSCGEPPVPGSKLTGDAVQFTETIDAACQTASVTFAKLDAEAAAGDLDRASYLTAVSEELTALSDDISDAGQHPVENLRDDVDDLVTALDAAASAAADGTNAALTELNSEISDLGQRLSALSCTGVTADLSAPSGLLVTPTLPPVTLTGFDGATVVNSEQFAAQLLELALVSTTPDPDSTFGVAATIEASLPALRAVPGDQSADPSTVSISAPRPSRDGTASASNPWVAGFAFMDSSGSCRYGRMWGFPRPTGFEAVPGDAACTGDAAIDGFSLPELLDTDPGVTTPAPGPANSPRGQS